MHPRLSRLIGQEGWQRTLLIMFIAQLVSAIGFSNIFPFLPLYVQALGSYTSTFSVEFWAGMVFSAQAVTMMIASPFWGVLADRYGRKVMVQRAMFGGAIILLLMGFVRSAEELVLLRAVQGLVTGTVSAANALVAASAPRERTGYAMAVLQVGLWGGVAVGPLIGGLTADSLGYRATFVLTSLLLFAAGVLVRVGIQEQFVPALDVGERRMGFMSGWRHILAQPGVSLTYLLRFLSHLGRTMIMPVAPLFIQLLLPHTQRVNTFTGLVIGMASAASTASALYLGRLGDRIGHRQVLMVSTFAAAVLYLPQTFVAHAWQLLILQTLTGLAAGGIIPSLSALLARYTKPGEEGSVYGLDNSIGAAARAVAPLAGAAVAVWFGLRLTFAATGLLFLLMTLLAVWYLPRTEWQRVNRHP
jgi:MFS transporter, DHA1 family, multidrug resistance protein